jgi:hypothetical protein
VKALSILGVGVFMLTSAAVGTRLLLLWRRTHQLPELLLTIALWCIGVLGFALGMTARLSAVGAGAPHPLAVSALCAEYIGCGALVVFAWRVFHPRESWAKGLAGVVLALMLGALLAEIGSGQFLHYADGSPISGPIVPLGLAARGLGPAWLSYECFRYHAMLRRRLELGLAELAVVHRIALWGMATLSTASGYAISVAHRSIFGTGLQAHGWALGSVSLLALVSALGVGLAFFPPPFYRRWVGEE